MTRWPIILLIANEMRGIAVVAGSKSLWWPLVAAHPVVAGALAWLAMGIVFVAIWSRIPRGDA